VNRKVLEALIKSGACDTFGETRATLFAQIDHCLTRAASLAADRQRGQSSLFGMLGEAPKLERESSTAKLPEWDLNERLAAEKELLGFYVTGHPITPYLPLLEKYALVNSATAAAVPPRTLTRIGGLVSAVQQGISKKSNKPYAMITIEDMEGTLQMLCMNENYDKYRELFVPGLALLITGEVNNGEDKPKIFPQEIMLLDDAPKKFTRQIQLRLHEDRTAPERLEAVFQLTQAHPGKCPLFFCVIRKAGELVFIEAHEKFSVMPSRTFQEEVTRLLGEDAYYAKVDSSLPERAARKWEKKSSGDDE
jgi:DNA polymerase-3 subunit alpha